MERELAAQGEAVALPGWADGCGAGLWRRQVRRTLAVLGAFYAEEPLIGGGAVDGVWLGVWVGAKVVVAGVAAGHPGGNYTATVPSEDGRCWVLVAGGVRQGLSGSWRTGRLASGPTCS